MSAFTWAQGRSHPVKAQVAGEYLEGLEKRDGGITARQVLEESRPPDAVLHPCFTWDDAKAAEKWRLNESRQLISDLQVIKPTPKAVQDEGPKEVKIKAYIRTTEGNETARYESTWEAIAKEDARKIIVDNAKKEMDSWIKRYRDILDIADLIDEILEEERIREREEKEREMFEKKRRARVG